MAARRAPVRAAPVEKEVPNATTRKKIGDFVELCAYATMEDIFPVPEDPAAPAEGTYPTLYFLDPMKCFQSYSNMCLPPADQLMQPTKRISLVPGTRALLDQLCREYIKEARDCASEMLRYKSKTFVSEYLSLNGQETQLMSIVTTNAAIYDEMIGDTEDTNLFRCSDPNNFITAFVSGEIMKNPTHNSVKPYADILATAFVKFLKRFAWSLGTIFCMIEHKTLSLADAAGNLIQMAFDAKWVYNAAEAIEVAAEAVKRENAEKKKNKEDITDVDDTESKKTTTAKGAKAGTAGKTVAAGTKTGAPAKAGAVGTKAGVAGKAGTTNKTVTKTTPAKAGTVTTKAGVANGAKTTAAKVTVTKGKKAAEPVEPEPVDDADNADNEVVDDDAEVVDNDAEVNDDAEDVDDEPVDDEPVDDEVDPDDEVDADDVVDDDE